ncbi:sorbitol dehydrogenase-like [Copidosoma floridanum]|uniref:sorbitol dehydrogenase-like n=1 Tax=Copidosoma floridanum TaxID=29053 RepID=UPI000C6F9129|nr:sorbitol dehydrogenase-like [Copidosoma floridanum]
MGDDFGDIERFTKFMKLWKDLFIYKLALIQHLENALPLQTFDFANLKVLDVENNKLPDNVSLEEGALLEPLAVGVYACKRAKIEVGANVLILGAGPIGLVTLLVAKARGASTVIIADLNESRINLAKQLGADDVYLVKKESEENKNVEQICRLFDEKPSITIDACGFESSIRLAIQVTKTGGKAVIVGMGANEVKLPLINALCREVDILGVFRYANDSFQLSYVSLNIYPRIMNFLLLQEITLY